MSDAKSAAGTTEPKPKPTIGDDLHAGLVGALMVTSPKTASDLFFEILATSTKPAPEEGQLDTRAEEIQTAVEEATPEVRTRAARLATALVPILSRCRALILAVKSEQQDADVTHGDAEVLPDGWLVVTMAGEQIGRVPYNPERGMQEAGRMAEEILAEHVRLHVARPTEVVQVPLPNDAGELPPRPDGVRARRLVVQ